MNNPKKSLVVLGRACVAGSGASALCAVGGKVVDVGRGDGP